MNFPYFIARRLYRGDGTQQSKRRASTPAIHIATAGVALGLAVMIISVSVVQGFKGEISRKVVGFGSHIEVMDVGTFGAPEHYPINTSEAFVQSLQATPGISHAQRFTQKLGILKTANDFLGITLKGVDEDYDLSFIRENMQEGQLPTFRSDTASNQLVISRTQADALHLKVGDKVYAYFFEQTVKTRRFTIAGIYQSNLAQFDKIIAITDKRTVNKLNHWPDTLSTGVELLAHDFDHLPAASAAITGTIRRHYHGENTPVAITIKEHYPQIFSWLSLLDMNVWVILALMICVAGFTMVSGLFILILERTNTIGLLKALGAANRSVRHVFLHFAVFITLKGLLIGNLIGIGLVGAQQQWGFAKLDPATYYVESVPVSLNPWVILLLNAATLALTTLALVGPSFMISRIQPAKAIRFE